MALNPCVKQILCSLSDAALGALQGIINGQVALLQAQILIYQTQILQFDVLSLPVQAAQAAGQAVVDNVRSSAALVPLNIISQCVDLGDFNLNLQQSIDVVLSSTEDLLAEATRLLSYREELNAIVTELDGAITQFTDISGIIDQCLSS